MFYSSCGKSLIFMTTFICIAVNSQNRFENSETILRSNQQLQEKHSTAVKIRHKRSQKKVLEFEDAPEELLKSLDMTCVTNGELIAPEIENGKLLRVEQRRGRENEQFIVAFYSCADGYSFELESSNKLYCSQKSWIGRKPECKRLENDATSYDVQKQRINKENEDEYKEDDYEDEQDDDEYEDEKEDEVTTMRNEITQTTPPAFPLFGKKEESSTFHPNIKVDDKEILPTSFSLYPDSFDDTDNYIYEDYNELNAKENEKDLNNNKQIIVDETKKLQLTTSLPEQISTSTSEIVGNPIIPTTESPEITSETIISTEDSIYDTTTELNVLIDSNFNEETTSLTSTGNTDTSYTTHKELEYISTTTRDYTQSYEEYTTYNNFNSPKDVTEGENEFYLDNNFTTELSVTTFSLPKGTVSNEVSTEDYFIIDDKNAEVTTFDKYPSVTKVPDISQTTTKNKKLEFYDDEDEYEGSGELDKTTKQITRDYEVTTIPSYLRCSHSVKEVDGTKKCLCPSGFKLSIDNVTCEDIDECNEINNCEHVCHNTEGSYRCSCHNGFEEQSEKCVDIDECLINNGGCSQTCTNNIGSYLCACFENHRIIEDGSTCIVVDECLENNGGCSHSCNSIDGVATCTCPLGYFLENKTCILLNPCIIANGGCSDFCENINGQPVCNCPEGYELVGKDCYEVDPCSINNGDCAHYCEYLNKTVICSCRNDYVSEGNACVKSNPCSIFNGGCSHNCNITIDGNVQCWCPDGHYLQNKTCIIEDPCTVNNGNCTHLCINEKGVVRCDCPEGFSLKNDECVVTDLCKLNNGGCSHDCISVEGVAQCQCPKGHKLQNYTCEPHNPCLDDNGGCEHVCVYLDFEVKCSCHDGFIQEATFCRRKDPCTEDNGGCSHTCTSNEEGISECRCPNEYTLINKTCVILNPCSKNNGNCSHICKNVDGKAKCYCPVSYHLSNSTQCEKSSACDLENGGCSDICNDLQGKAVCSCPIGYHLIERECYKDDSCSANNGGCSHNCNTTSDGFTFCTCPEGYNLNNKTCERINSCKIQNGGCSHQCKDYKGTVICDCPLNHKLVNNTCVFVNPCSNSNGGCSHICKFENTQIQCRCPEDYVLHGKKCVHNNPCHFKNGGCSHTCINIKGEAICECPLGMTLKNRQCSESDPCSIRNGGCSHNCSNIDGQAQCSCPEGLRLDNNICVGFNPCLKENGGCSHRCENNFGNVSCSCPSGHILRPNRRVCKEINQCRRNYAKCSHGCKNIPGSFLCTCPKGFSLNNGRKQCVDINECTENNGDCKEGCRNYPGGYRCSCNNGQTLERDKRSCRAINKECVALIPPRNGYIKCSHDVKENYYPTGSHCVVSCNPGYKLHGDPYRICAASGEWGRSYSHCEQISCPKLGQVARGNWIPFNCTTDAVLPGQECSLQCENGYKPLQGYESTKCVENQQWYPQFNLGSIWRACIKESFEPTIQCPNGGYLSYNLPHGQKTVFVEIPKTEANVDWLKYVTVEPSWAKNFSGYLGPGRTEIIFTAYSPTDKSTASCRLIISIFDKESPKVSNCPSDMEFRLAKNEHSQVVYWDEPNFYDNVKIAEVYKSKEPGTRFSAGLHQINYVAHDEAGNKVGCHFSINILSEDSVENKPSEYKAILICPHGIRYMSGVPNNQDGHVSTQNGCYWSNIRVKRPAGIYNNYKEIPKSSHIDRNQRFKKSPFYWYHKCC